MISLSRLLSLILCLAALAAVPLRAQETQPKESPLQESPQAAPATPEAVPEPPLPMKTVPLNIPMEAFGTANPACLEWTDSCRTCSRDAENNISCSTPGIACLPQQDIACKKERGK
jgi:hypothetical protein